MNACLLMAVLSTGAVIYDQGELVQPGTQMTPSMSISFGFVQSVSGMPDPNGGVDLRFPGLVEGTVTWDDQFVILSPTEVTIPMHGSAVSKTVQLWDENTWQWKDVQAGASVDLDFIWGLQNQLTYRMHPIQGWQLFEGEPALYGMDIPVHWWLQGPETLLEGDVIIPFASGKPNYPKSFDFGESHDVPMGGCGGMTYLNVINEMINDFDGMDVRIKLSGATGCVLHKEYFWPIPGDANLDGWLNSSDLVAVFAGGKYETGEPADWRTGDWTGNGLFTSGDLVAALRTGRYDGCSNQKCPWTGWGPEGRWAVAVPEPSAMVLLAIGLLVLTSRTVRKY